MTIIVESPPRAIVVGCVFALLASARARAEPPAPSPSDTPLAPPSSALPVDVVVTGRGSEEARRESAVAIEVVSREEIATGGARDLAQAIASEAGVQIESSFRGDALALRGLDPQHTLVLVDGERLVGARDGALDLTRFFAGDVERVEIVKGSSSPSPCAGAPSCSR